MKISSSFMQFLCGALFLTSFTPAQAQFDGMKQQLQNTFNNYWKRLKDFQNCFTGKKECSPREKKVKTGTLIAGGLILLSLILYVVPRVPGKMHAWSTIRNIEGQISAIKRDIGKLQPKIIALNKKIPTGKEVASTYQPLPGEQVKSYMSTEVDPKDPQGGPLMVTRYQTIPSLTDQDIAARAIVDQFTQVNQALKKGELKLQEVKQMSSVDVEKRLDQLNDLSIKFSDFEKEIKSLQEKLPR